MKLGQLFLLGADAHLGLCTLQNTIQKAHRDLTLLFYIQPGNVVYKIRYEES